jgi:MoxR-like ATPase
MITTIEEGIKFWHDILGMNTIPADTRNKKPLVDWKHWQTEGIPDQFQKYWITHDKFGDGINVILGKIHHSVGLKDYYLSCIDLDNPAAIQEFCNFKGKQITLQEISKHGFLVEQHLDNPERAHIYVITKKPLKKKVSSIPISGKYDENIPKIEVKSDGTCLVSVTPSVHANGCKYEFIGDYKKFTDDLIFHDKNFIEEHIDKICRKYNIEYLNGDAKAIQNYNPVLRNKQPLPKGERHNKLVSYANSLIARLYKTTNRQTILRFFETYNNEECEEPLPESELKQIFNDAWNNIGKSNTSNRREQKQENTNNVLSVLEAKRLHIGQISVIGTIVSISEMYILEFNDPNNMAEPEHKDARSIQLEDSETLNEIERLDVVLYNDMIWDVIAGEVVKITGNMKIESRKENGKGKRKINVLHATSIEHINRKQVVISDEDIKNIQEFAEKPDVIKRLVAMFAPNVVGHDDEKLGLLRSEVGGVDHGREGGGLIDTLLVGDPGTAKSTLAREATKVKPNSRFVSAPYASTKTLTAIVDKESDSSTFLRLGAIPLSRGAICAINEVTTFSLEEQSRLLDILEERRFPLDKYGHHYDILSPTTIIATANPVGSKWNNPQVISNDEINLRKSLLDRFTQIYGFRDMMTEDQTKEFVKEMSRIRQEEPHDYDFLRKYLIYASSLKPNITLEAQEMLNEFWANAKIKGLLTIRMYNGLYKIAEAQAKLQLKDEVDEEVAKQTIESVQLMMAQYGQTVRMVIGPKDATFKAFLEILQRVEIGITIEELCKIACDENTQVSNYLGENWSIKHNIKLRSVVDMLLNHSDIKKIQSHPIVLKFLSDASDVGDTDPNKIHDDNKDETIKNTEYNKNETVSLTAPTSPRADNTSPSIDESPESKVQNDEYPPSCYYCNEYFDGIGKQCYEKHVLNRHPKKPCYPGLADIELYSLTQKGMNWEK